MSNVIAGQKTFFIKNQGPIVTYKGYNSETKQQLLYIYFAFWRIKNNKYIKCVYIPFNIQTVGNHIVKIDSFEGWSGWTDK